MRGLFYSALLLLLSVTAWGQPHWELGFTVGGSNYLGDLVETRWPVWKETKPMFGVWSSYRLSKTLGLRLNANYAGISGDDRNFSTSYFVDIRNVRFTSDLFETALVATWEPFGKRRYPNGADYRPVLSPYVFGGIGLLWQRVDTDFSEVPNQSFRERVQTDKRDLPQGVLPVIPIGFGLKQDLSKGRTLSIETGLRTARTDYLDGVSRTGNPRTDDWYVFAGVSLAFRFGEWDSDGDGLLDSEDACPREAGNLSARGCPDQDGDGVEDLEDICPDIPGVYELSGCPDLDRDNIADRFDRCPFVQGLPETQGCPDMDRDGVRDGLDECPAEAGTKLLLGCPDCDGDGIANENDDCPTVPGSFAFNGCPYSDLDRDGIPDEDDRCPELAGPLASGGCPDTDGDGVTDAADKCPDLAGVASNEGCPPLPEEARTVLDLARRNVKFETGSATLKAASRDILDEIAALMKEYDYYYLSIAGHTDSRGKDALNLKLSKERAEACYTYLIGQGVAADRMSHEGYGETKPIGDNRTAAGRQLNRRVAFELHLDAPEE